MLATATPERLAKLDYDFDRLLARMTRRDWTTLQLVHRAEPEVFARATRFQRLEENSGAEPRSLRSSATARARPSSRGDTITRA